MGNKIGRGLVARRLGGSTLVGMSSCSSTRSTLLIRKCRRQNNGWAKSQLTSSMVTQQKNIDLEEPTPLTDQVCLGSAQRESVTKQSEVKIKSCFFCLDHNYGHGSQAPNKKLAKMESRTLELRHEEPCRNMRGTLLIFGDHTFCTNVMGMTRSRRQCRTAAKKLK